MKSPIMAIVPAVLLGLFSVPSHAVVYDLDVAVQNVRDNCLGIGSRLDHLKMMAGINTGVQAVGTAVGAGALAAGIVKAQKDKEIEEILQRLAKNLATAEPASDEDLDGLVQDLEDNWDKYSKELAEASQVDKLTEESKTLGNVRTGLLATNTAAQVAGAVMSSQNKANGSLKEQINACIAATDDLKDSIMQARLENIDTTKAKQILDACGEYKYADLSKINNLATGATVTSSIGAVAGGIGTITSAVANTDSTRNDNSAEGKAKEQNLNTASNVLSGFSTATSAVSTVLNGVQIATIKKVVSVSDNCEKELR